MFIIEVEIYNVENMSLNRRFYQSV